MGVREKIGAAAAPFLQEGEVVQTAFGAMGTNPMWSLLSYWIIIAKDANRAVVVTDRRIILAKTSRARWSKFKEIVAEVPRSTKLGEPSGMNWKNETFGQPIWIHKRFHKDVREADVAAAG